jgi:hypothetical protein
MESNMEHRGVSEGGLGNLEEIPEWGSSPIGVKSDQNQIHAKRHECEQQQKGRLLIKDVNQKFYCFFQVNTMSTLRRALCGATVNFLQISVIEQAFRS